MNLENIYLKLFGAAGLLIALCCFCVAQPDDGSLSQLRYFETLKASDVNHRITKRGTHGGTHRFNTIKEVAFRTHGKEFRLILNPSKGLLSPRFKAYAVDRNGKRDSLLVNPDQFYEGRVYGTRESNVTAHLDEDGRAMTAAIRLPDEIYLVEPAWRHLPGSNDTSTMIVYRASDVIQRDSAWDPITGGLPHAMPYCGYVKVDDNATVGEPNVFNSKYAGIDELGRKRREAEAYPLRYEPMQTRCSLLLVADHRFFMHMGGGDHKMTVNYLISLIDRVNKIFLDTEWKETERGPGFRGMGFVIQEILVHKEPTIVQEGDEHYNMADRSWNVRDLLEVFSREDNHRWFCLAHLFTDQKFDGGILGLAYVGSPRRNSVGGICSPGYVKNGYTLFLNSGLSTSRNHYNNRVVTREADLVTAHGHNWGSEHDPDLPECSPDSQKGGSYLMYTYSVSGYDPNNKKFSPCSVRAVRAVLLAKANKCFSKPEESFCGNSLVEEEEECDAGLLGSEKKDPCCDDECRLRKNARCSDRNSPCCENCQYQTMAGTSCRESQPLSCKTEAFCTGQSPECPNSLPQPNDTECLDRGKCVDGECRPFCETMGLSSCMCDTEINACKRCCKANLNATCEPIHPIEVLKDGTPCVHGFCDKGRCERTVQDIVERFWDIIEDIDINRLLKFLYDNVVLVVIIVLGIIWVPGSYLASFMANKRREEFELIKKRKLFRMHEPPYPVPKDPTVPIVYFKKRRPSATTAAPSVVNGGVTVSGDARKNGELRLGSDLHNRRTSRFNGSASNSPSNSEWVSQQQGGGDMGRSMVNGEYFGRSNDARGPSTNNLHGVNGDVSGYGVVGRNCHYGSGADEDGHQYVNADVASAIYARGGAGGGASATYAPPQYPVPMQRRYHQQPHQQQQQHHHHNHHSRASVSDEESGSGADVQLWGCHGGSDPSPTYSR